MGDQKPDFSGWASVNDQKCSDGRTIKAGAFAHMDGQTVPLIWQHKHDDAFAVLGHAKLENRAFGVFCHGYFNDSEAGIHARAMVKNKDVQALSIYANNLNERRVDGGREVYHGDIKEVSLVLAGANPGAVIENVNIVHGDKFEEIDSEAYIYNEQTLSLSHSEDLDEGSDDDETDNSVQEVLDSLDDEQKVVVHHLLEGALTHAQGGSAHFEHADVNMQSVYDSLNATQKMVVTHLIGEALAHSESLSEGETMPNADTLEHADKTVQEVFDEFTDEQKAVVYFMIGEALDADSGSADAKHSGLSEEDKESFLAHFDNRITEGFDAMRHNLFEQNGLTSGDALVAGTGRAKLTHSQLDTIMTDAKRDGSLKEAILAHAQDYGIQDIDLLFPDAKALQNTPELLKRRTEWVTTVLEGTKHSPFSRIKTLVADITAEEARAKGYVKGNLKKDEVIKLLKRVTTPTTVYKKQKLDRDDIIDIVDLDVVAWLKAEMRLMLDEEIARAILIGDGREVDDEDKIDEDHIRPIAFDHEMYSHVVTLAAESSANDVVEGILYARRYYKGTGNPVLFTTDEVLTDLILQKDKVGRRLYETEESLAAALRVSRIVTVEVMEDTPEILGIIVNLTDYTVGADAGGRIGMFDDFDIDYNQYKYLIESRISGALTKPKSALVIKKNLGTVVSPTQPTYDPATHVITIPSQTGVKYFIENVEQTAGALPAITESTEVEARPATGYSFPHGIDADWFYVY
jgi:HK97 family phage prohead protease